MKNLSLPKLLGLFGGFLAGVLVVAAIVVRGGHGGVRPVTTKVYHHERPVASRPDLVPPTAAAMGDPYGPSSQRPAPAVPRSAPTDEGTRVVADISPPSLPPTASCAPATDPMPQVNALDGRLAALTARVGALEASAAEAAVRSRSIARPVRPKTQASMDGYKTMAVVGDRAWVRMPDGTEESATKGDALPRPRVRSVSHDTGIIITSTDERIDSQ